MRIDIFIHHVDNYHDNMEYIKSRFDKLDKQGVKLMAKVDELLAELGRANEATNDIADDITELLAKLAGGLSEAEAEQVKSELTVLSDKLHSVAAQYPAPPAEPGEVN